MEVQITHLIVTQRSKSLLPVSKPELLLCREEQEQSLMVTYREQKEQLQKRLEEESVKQRLHCNKRAAQAKTEGGRGPRGPGVRLRFEFGKATGIASQVACSRIFLSTR